MSTEPERRLPTMPFADLRVHLRDLRTGSWVSNYDTQRWLEIHEELLDIAADMFMETFGGTLMVSGTAETGRVTVYPTTERSTPILDYDWHTYSVPAEAP